MKSQTFQPDAHPDSARVQSYLQRISKFRSLNSVTDWKPLELVPIGSHLTGNRHAYSDFDLVILGSSELSWIDERKLISHLEEEIRLLHLREPEFAEFGRPDIAFLHPRSFENPQHPLELHRSVRDAFIANLKRDETPQFLIERRLTNFLSCLRTVLLNPHETSYFKSLHSLLIDLQALSYSEEIHLTKASILAHCQDREFWIDREISKLISRIEIKDIEHQESLNKLYEFLNEGLRFIIEGLQRHLLRQGLTKFPSDSLPLSQGDFQKWRWNRSELPCEFGLSENGILQLKNVWTHMTRDLLRELQTLLPMESAQLLGQIEEFLDTSEIRIKKSAPKHTLFGFRKELALPRRLQMLSKNLAAAKVFYLDAIAQKFIPPLGERFYGSILVSYLPIFSLEILSFEEMAPQLHSLCGSAPFQRADQLWPDGKWIECDKEEAQLGLVKASEASSHFTLESEFAIVPRWVLEQFGLKQDAIKTFKFTTL